MAILVELYETKLELLQKEEELEKLKEEYSSYRKIVESTINNKNVRAMRKHISWMGRDELKKGAKEIEEQEWLEGCLEKARRSRAKKETEN